MKKKICSCLIWLIIAVMLSVLSVRSDAETAQVPTSYESLRYPSVSFQRESNLHDFYTIVGMLYPANPSSLCSSLSLIVLDNYISRAYDAASAGKYSSDEEEEGLHIAFSGHVVGCSSKDSIWMAVPKDGVRDQWIVYGLNVENHTVYALLEFFSGSEDEAKDHVMSRFPTPSESLSFTIDAGTFYSEFVNVLTQVNEEAF